MDRRFFLTGMLGLAGAATVAVAIRPVESVAGVPHGNGILDELETSDAALIEDGDGGAEVIEIDHRRHHRRRRRRVWRRVCRRYWRHGRRYVRCHRVRVWVWYWG